MTNIGLFVDTSDLYHRVRRKFNGKLCYDAYYGEVSGWGTMQQAVAYGMQVSAEAGGFITCLRMAGFDTRFKRPKIMRVGDREIKRCDHGVMLAVDVVKAIDQIDTVVLGVSNPDYIPLVKWVRDRGAEVTILASCVPRSLRDIANTVIEIDEGYLEDEDAEH